jgi:D-alanyl-D-alanine carboxypeptidase
VPKGFYSDNPDDHSVPRSIRTNNPGALNISGWQKTRQGFVGVTEPDQSGNQTTIYRTPEHGIGAWFHLLSVIYGFGKKPSFRIGELAQRYSGRDSGAVVDAYVAGWSGNSHGTINAQTDISLADDAQTLNLSRAMFRHEAGKESPLHDDQISYAVVHERDGTLPA